MGLFGQSSSMNPDDIFCKTARGQDEIRTRSQGLSMQQRRVLILVNGSNDVAELQRLSLYENAADILLSLVEDGFIKAGSDTSPSSATAAQDYAIADSST
jgi:hypothetical protein